MYLGLSLLHRYRNKRDDTYFEQLLSLIDPEDAQEAEVLGKAMRLGAMLWMSKKDKDGATLQWSAKKKHLELTLSEDARPLFGEVAEARLKSLAAALDASYSAPSTT